jgi:hypothetical protein
MVLDIPRMFKMVWGVVAGDSYMVWGVNMSFINGPGTCCEHSGVVIFHSMDGPGHSQNVQRWSGKLLLLVLLKFSSSANLVNLEHD